MSEMEKVRDAARQADGVYGEGDDVYDGAFDAGYSAAAQSGWVDVEERLPTEYGSYEVTVEDPVNRYREVAIVTFVPDWPTNVAHIWGWDITKRLTVVAWRQKSPPYQREGAK